MKDRIIMSKCLCFNRFLKIILISVICMFLFNLPAAAAQKMSGSQTDIPVQYYRFAGFEIAYQPGMPPISYITIPAARPSRIPATIELKNNKVSGGIIGKGYPMSTLGSAKTGDDDVMDMAEIGDAIRVVFDYPVFGYNVKVYKAELSTIDNTVRLFGLIDLDNIGTIRINGVGVTSSGVGDPGVMDEDFINIAGFRFRGKGGEFREGLLVLKGSYKLPDSLFEVPFLFQC